MEYSIGDVFAPGQSASIPCDAPVEEHVAFSDWAMHISQLNWVSTAYRQGVLTLDQYRRIWTLLFLPAPSMTLRAGDVPGRTRAALGFVNYSLRTNSASQSAYAAQDYATASRLAVRAAAYNQLAGLYSRYGILNTAEMPPSCDRWAYDPNFVVVILPAMDLATYRAVAEILLEGETVAVHDAVLGARP